MVYLKSVENVITLGKLIGLLFLFCLPLLSILFLKTKRNDLAHPVMGTIFLVLYNKRVEIGGYTIQFSGVIAIKSLVFLYATQWVVWGKKLSCCLINLVHTHTHTVKQSKLPTHRWCRYNAATRV